jgi:uncharacterized membrane protein
MITTWNKVDQGTSGGITLIGTLAAMGGASLIAIMAVVFSPTPDWFSHLMIIVLAGLAGSLFDSVLGATIQAIFWCPTCSKETERHPLHTCGTQTNQVRGWSWVNNDVVNFGCSLMGAILTCSLVLLVNY